MGVNRKMRKLLEKLEEGKGGAKGGNARKQLERIAPLDKAKGLLEKKGNVEQNEVPQQITGFRSQEEIALAERLYKRFSTEGEEYRPIMNAIDLEPVQQELGEQNQSLTGQDVEAIARTMRDEFFPQYKRALEAVSAPTNYEKGFADARQSLDKAIGDMARIVRILHDLTDDQAGKSDPITQGWQAADSLQKDLLAMQESMAAPALATSPLGGAHRKK